MNRPAPEIIEIRLPKDAHGNDFADRLPDTSDAKRYKEQDDIAVKAALEKSYDEATKKFGVIRGSGDWQTPMEWEILDLIPRKSIGYLGGPSASGKTFAAVELIGSIITGMPAFGQYDVERSGAVIYCAVEGRQGIAHRFEAWRGSRNVCQELWEKRLFQTFNFFNFESSSPSEMIRHAKAVESEGEKVALIVFDTLRTFGAINKENDSSHAQKAAAWIREVSQELDCSVMCIHHSGKSSDNNMIEVGCKHDRLLRGSSDLGATAEFVIGVTQSENTEGQTVPWFWPAKLKDAEKRSPIAIPIATHQLLMQNGKFQEVGVISQDINPDMQLSARSSAKRKPSNAEKDAQHIARFVSRSSTPCEREDIRRDFYDHLKRIEPENAAGSNRSRLSRAYSYIEQNIEELEIHMSGDGSQFHKFPFHDD